MIPNCVPRGTRAGRGGGKGQGHLISAVPVWLPFRFAPALSSQRQRGLCSARAVAARGRAGADTHTHGPATDGQVINVYKGPCEDRLMTTGLHTVQDIFCTSCQQLVGWKYERAFEKSQKYKVRGCFACVCVRQLAAPCLRESAPTRQSRPSLIQGRALTAGLLSCAVAPQPRYTRAKGGQVHPGARQDERREAGPRQCGASAARCAGP